MIDRLLLPTDGSETADRATDHAANLAQRYEADVHVVYVVDAGALNLGTGIGEGYAGVVDKLRAAGQDEAQRVADELREAGVDATAETVDQDGVPDGILTYADEHGVDAIVMGTHGRSGPERWLVGSVAEGVLRASSIPVMLIPPEPDEG